MRLLAVAFGVVVMSAPRVALASSISIGGLDVNTGPYSSVSTIFENVATSVGDSLSGYGIVNSIDGILVGSLCSGCELTYRFIGYTVTSVSPTLTTFSGGTYRFYLGFGADADFTTANPGGSAGDLFEATNGTLFLTLTGHAIDSAGNTLLDTHGLAAPTGSMSGLFDVDTSGGGIANSYFDTNSILALFGGPADLSLVSEYSSLSPTYPAECPGGAACRDGSATFAGNVAGAAPSPVPEPSTLLMLGGGLVALLRKSWRRR